MKVFDSFDIGWQYAKKHGILISLLCLCAYFLVNFLFSKCLPEEFWREYVAIAQITDPSLMMVKMNKLFPYVEEAMPKMMLVFMLQCLLFFGVMNVALSIVIGETKGVNIKYLSLPFLTYLKVIEIMCVMFLLFLLGSYAFELPFVFFGIRLIFVVPLVLENPQCPLSVAMKKSWQMTRGHFFQILGFCLLVALCHLIGMFCFFVGMFFASALCIFAFLALYKQGLLCFGTSCNELKENHNS